MTADELEKKIIAIKKRGLNIMVEQDLIAQLRAEYYSEKVHRKISNMSALFVKNLNYLAKMHRDMVTVNKIRLHMGVMLNHDEDNVFRGESNLYSLRVATIAAEYYGLPVDYLLFTDIEANEQTFLERYPALIQQNRN